jgi:hypothetical protein
VMQPPRTPVAGVKKNASTSLGSSATAGDYGAIRGSTGLLTTK